jgi:hypothetical protein
LRATAGLPAEPANESWYITASAGNPYHLTELALRNIHTRDSSQFQASLLALIRQRFDRLRPDSLRVLQCCAVLGKHSTIARLRDVLELRNSDMLDCLDELERNGLLDVSDQHVRCRHELVASVALAEQGAASTKLLHLGVARVLDAAAADTKSPGVRWEAAEHWLCAGEYHRASEGMRACAAHAMQIGSPMKAAQVLRRALELPTDVIPRKALLFEYVSVLERGCLWNELIVAIQELRAAQSPAESVQHDEYEILMLDAQRRCGSDPRMILEELRNCVRSRTSASHRISAAAAAFKICDNICRHDIAHAVMADLGPAIRDTAVAREIQLECELIYHCSFGDLARVVGLAREWRDLSDERGNEGRHPQTLLYCGIAFKCAGLLEESRDSLIEGYDFAVQREIALPASAAADELSSLAFSLGNIEEAKMWVERATSWGRQASVAFATPSALMQAITVAIALEDFEQARELVAECDEHFAIIQHYPRAQASFLALRLYLALRQYGAVPSHTDLERLLSLHSITRHITLQDYPTFVIAELLRASHRETDSARLVTGYVLQRRDRSPLLPQLASLLELPGLSSARVERQD